MRLTVIGSGTAVPEADRVASGYLVECEGARILLDCGPGVAHGLARAGADWSALTHVALTHFHNDHIGDVPALFFALKYGLRPVRTAPLVLIGPAGTRALIDALPPPLGAHVRDPGFPLDIVELPGGGEMVAGAARLHAWPTVHTETSIAYRIEAGARVIGYTGDTGADDALADFMRGVHILVCECSLPDDEEQPTHLTPTTAAALAVRAEPGVLVLTHVYPQLDRGALAGLVNAAGWTGRTLVAHDGLIVDA